MNDHEMDRIAAAVSQLRPDWPTKSIRTLLSKPELASRARRDVAVALTWVACEPDSATPARVLESGPWWRAAAVEGTLTRRHPSPDEACLTCGRDYGPTCCDRPTNHREPSDPTAGAARVRAALQERETGASA
jgi:hypothetical protein